TVTADDGQGGSVDDLFTWTVSNPAPTVGAPTGPQAGFDAQTVSLDVSGAFTDVDGDTLTYSATGLPPGLTIDPVSGVISGTIAANASLSGPYAVTVTADDGQGGSVDDLFTWTVSNPAPTLVNNTGLTLMEGATAGIDKTKLEFTD
ncbi:MAG: hypothetical protein GWN79_21075, partial [Actinobacteria bacterium]|nr:hypothetical protein [Actinomycetota bacterium]NIU21408.1 hypothetical protein [Actinomycetota bacterium]NIV57953.1 hypothetical protein [Actinomycetota bacterium]NIV89470.1 hypothetical protein [Actinomycetota bacterium]